MIDSPPASMFPADALAQAVGELGGLLEVRAGHEDQELLAAEAVGEVEGAQLLAQQVGHLLEHHVADRMAVGVVDRLKWSRSATITPTGSP